MEKKSRALLFEGGTEGDQPLPLLLRRQKMKQATRRRARDTLEIQLPTELGLLSGKEKFLNLCCLGCINRADLGDLVTLIGGQMKEFLFTGG